MLNPHEIGRRLRQLRGSQTRSEVASSVGISVSALSMYEIGQRVPRDEIKLSLANHYGVSVEDIFYSPISHIS